MNLQLKNRQIDILKCLIASATPIDVDVFIDKYQKSERTIRYDINIIRDELLHYEIEIKTKSKKGFYIPATQKQKCSALLGSSQPLDSSLLDDRDETRYTTLFLYFFVAKKRVSALEIGDSFFVSKSTVLRFMGSFETYFNHQVKLTAQKSTGYLMEGDEYKLRRIASDILVKLLKGSYSSEDWYMLLPPILKNEITLTKIIRISNAIKKINTLHNVWISNDAFIQLLCYCLVQGIRNSKGRYHTNGSVKLAIERINEHDYINDLLNELCGEINADESEWLLNILKENGISVQEHKKNAIELTKIIDEMIEILNRNEHHYPYAFDTMTLYDDLYEHLLHSKLDEEQAPQEDNPLLAEIKSKYAPFFNIARECAKAFDHVAQIQISESELSYIAIYLYKNLINSNSSNKKVLIVCATGKGLSNLLTTRIKNVFQNLTIVGQASPFQVDRMHQYRNIDFVISTIPLPECIYPVVKISRILSMEDIQRIQEFLHYGKFIDNIPFNQNHAASFNSKADPFDLFEVNTSERKENLAESTVIVSKLIITLLEYTSKFPAENQMNQDSILGLMIHLVLAIPRWYSHSYEEEDDVMEAYLEFKKKYNKVFILMEKFFGLVEEALLISISISERYAFFLYLINDEQGG